MNPVAARKARAEPGVAAVPAVTALFVIASAALAIRVGWLLWHGLGEIGWDGAEYATLATNLATGHGYLGIRGATLSVFPPFYSLTIAALLPFTADAVRAGVAVSLFSGAALVFPLYGIASIAYGRRAGYAAAVVAAVMPFAVQLSTVVLADMLFLTLTATGLFFLLRAVESHRYGDAAAVGIAFGLAYLTRPEGILLEALAAGVVLALSFERTISPRRVALLALATVLPFAALAAPYVAFLSSHAGHLRVEGKSLLNLDIGLRMDRGLSYTVAADAIDDRLNEIGPELRHDYYFEPVGRERPSLATILTFGAKNTVRHVSEIAHVAASRLCGTPALLALAIFGFVAGPWNRRRVRNQTILLAYGVAITVALASVFHFWERYFVGYVPLLIVWAANGVEVLVRAIERSAAGHRARNLPVVVTGLFLLALTFSTNVGFTDDAGRSIAERRAGTWLAGHGGQGARIAGISDQAVYYAHGIWSMLPWAPDEAAARRYVRKQHPDFIVLDRDYASERPYVIAWMRSGIPNFGARVVYTVAEAGAPAVVVLRSDDARAK